MAERRKEARFDLGHRLDINSPADARASLSTLREMADALRRYAESIEKVCEVIERLPEP
jgi:hypothetical protein